MGRKRDIRRRQELAEQAYEVIRSRGVHQTSMTELAAALDMKRPTLYWYFKDLGEIFDAVLESKLNAYQLCLAEQLLRVDHPLDRLIALIRADISFHGPRPDDLITMFQLWAVGRSRDPAAILARGRAELQPLRQAAIEVVREGIAEGRVRPCEPEPLVDMLLAYRDGIQVQRVVAGADPAALCDTFVRVVLDPLRLEDNQETS